MGLMGEMGVMGKWDKWGVAESGDGCAGRCGWREWFGCEKRW